MLRVPVAITRRLIPPSHTLQSPFSSRQPALFARATLPVPFFYSLRTMASTTLLVNGLTKAELAKALHAAKLTGAEPAVQLVASGPKLKLVAGSQSFIGDADSAAFYFFAAQQASAGTAAVAPEADEWLAWSRKVLSPAAAKAAAEKSLEPAAAALTALEARLAASPFLAGPAATVADIAVAAELASLQELLGSAAAGASSYPKASAYAQGLLSSDAFKAASAAAEKAVAAAPAPAAGGAGGAAAPKEAGAGKKEKKEKGGAGGAASAAPPAAGPADISSLTGVGALPLDHPLVTETSVRAALEEAFTAGMQAAFPSSKDKGMIADVVLNSTPKFKHHYQCNSALGLASKLKGCPDAPANPVAAGQALLAAMQAMSPPCPLIGRLELSGPGFINIYLSAGYCSSRVVSLLNKGPVAAKESHKHRVVVDYSSPNIAKDMHIGHLRSTIIGDTLARILEFCGHEVLRVNHAGDWGTQFGMLIAHMKDVQAGKAEGGVAAGTTSITDITALYKAAKKRFDAEPEFKERAHKEVVALQAGDAGNLSLWKQMVDISQQLFNEVYMRLGVDKRLELVGESFYNDKIAAVIEEMKAKGLLTDSDGAHVLFVPEMGEGVPPLIVRKGDGGFGYDSTDLAALSYRLRVLKADWLIYVVDAGQSLHFDLVFAGGRKAGWYKPSPKTAHGTTPTSSVVVTPAVEPERMARVEHVGFGVVQGEDKKKFKTRSGETVRLVDVLDEAKSRAAKQLQDRAASGAEAAAAAASASSALEASTAASAIAAASSAAAVLSDAAVADKTASVLGYGGVKYFDLKQNRLNDYVFNYERMLAPDGDTAVYLEYGHARLSSILRKAAAEHSLDIAALKASTAPLHFTHLTELALAAELLRFQDVLKAVQQDLMPHYLCEYLYAVAGKTAEFHRDCHVLSASNTAEVRDTRLRLVAATADTMKQCLALLGIEALDRI